MCGFGLMELESVIVGLIIAGTFVVQLVMEVLRNWVLLARRGVASSS
jgi:hypothetical protein